VIPALKRQECLHPVPKEKTDRGLQFNVPKRGAGPKKEKEASFRGNLSNQTIRLPDAVTALASLKCLRGWQREGTTLLQDKGGGFEDEGCILRIAPFLTLRPLKDTARQRTLESKQRACQQLHEPRGKFLKMFSYLLRATGSDDGAEQDS